MRRLDLHMREGDLFETALRAIRAADPIDYIVVPLEQKDRRFVSVFLRDGTRQTLLDNLQACLEEEQDWRISIVSVEATTPAIPEDKKLQQKRTSQRKLALREELYHDISADAKLDRDFVVLVILSTIVAAVGLHSNSVAAVIGDGHCSAPWTDYGLFVRGRLRGSQITFWCGPNARYRRCHRAGLRNFNLVRHPRRP